MSNDTTQPLPIRPGESPQEQPGRISQALHQALAGAVFPLSAEQLVRVARENETPSFLLSLLGDLPGREFDSLEAVQQQLAPRLERPSSR
jgi:hypothetical protein